MSSTLGGSLSAGLNGTKLSLVLDTNVVVSGLLWGGHSRRLLELALTDTLALYSSPVLVEELSQTLHYPKLAKRIAALQTTAQVFSLDDPADTDIQELWLNEARHRADEIDSGKAKLVSGEDLDLQVQTLFK